MTLIAGAGPQHLLIEIPSSPDISRWSVNGRAVLRYRFTRTSIALTYEKFTSSGSGFFAGADTQAARLGLTRPLARTWEVYLDFGYSHNSRLQSQKDFGLPGNTFDHGFARVLLRKHLGREYSAFAAYRFNDLSSNGPLCNTGTCGRSSERHMATIGVEWHPRPSRID
jgi:hypothetical protein